MDVDSLAKEVDVSDPSDFPEKAPALRVLDRTVRCPICKDFFNAPVLLSTCGHSFCSFCIRDAMREAEKKECPTCRTPLQESNLKKNVVVEEILNAYRAARGIILEGAVDMGKPKGKRRRSEEELPNGTAVNGGTQSPLPYPATKRARRSSEGSKIKVEEVEEDESDGGVEPGDPQAIVTCPVCEKSVTMSRLNTHMDENCPVEVLPTEKGKGKADWAMLMAGAGAGGKAKGKEKVKGRVKASRSSDGSKEASPPPPRPLAKVTYRLQSLKQVKALLSEHSLPLDGDRAHLETRHAQWITLYNANLDSSKPRSQNELRRELAAWERQRARDEKEKGARDARVADEGYAESQKPHFASLVAQARATARSGANAPPRSRAGSTSKEPILISSDIEIEEAS